MRSAIYTGFVQHRRFFPKTHQFKYRVFMPFIDLDELDSVFKSAMFWSATRKNLAFLNRTDFFGTPALSIKNSIIAYVQQHAANLAITRVCLLANLRYFGYSFNPISTYYCYDKDDQLVCLVAEVTNTPWHEKHYYLLVNNNPGQKQLLTRFKKDFHVSPFLPMDMSYRWQSNKPGENLYIHMQNFSSQEKKIFDATLVLQRQEITPWLLDRIILKYPFMTIQVVCGIYWQALKIYIKGMKFYPHPRASHQSLSGENP